MKAIFLVFIFGIMLVSCSSKRENVRNNSGSTLQLTYNWIVEVPSGFNIQRMQGVDTEVGFIYSKQDSVAFDYEASNYCGNNDLLNENTLNEFHPKECAFFRLIINGNPSWLILPKNGKGNYRLEVCNQNVGTLVIHGKNQKNKNLILTILRSVRTKNN